MAQKENAPGREARGASMFAIIPGTRAVDRPGWQPALSEGALCDRCKHQKHAYSLPALPDSRLLSFCLQARHPQVARV